MANRLIAQKGAPGVLTRSTPGDYDTATGGVVAPETTADCRAVMFPYGDEFVDGTLVLAGDQQVFMGPDVSIDPAPGDSLTWGGKTYQVIKVKTLRPAGVPVLHELQVRN
jgi:hypothetical protein